MMACPLWPRPTSGWPVIELPLPVSIWSRIRAAWWCLRGHSVVYRCEFVRGVDIDCHGLSFKVSHCIFPGEVQWIPPRGQYVDSIRT
jgi:hypothetical protein